MGRSGRQAAGDWKRNTEYEKDRDYLACVRDILDSGIFQSMDQYVQHGATTCREHCLQVSYLTYRICRDRGWDARAGARAGLLHDFFLYDWHTHARDTGNRFHGLTHPRTARDNAVRWFQIPEKEQNLILRHMWPLTPVPPRYKEGFALLYADKVCTAAEVAAQAGAAFAMALRPRQLG